LSRSKLAALLLGASLSTGCVSFLRPDGPRTVPVGQREFMLATSAYASERKDGNALNLDLMWRFGVSQRTDLGLRLNFAGVSADTKVQLVRAPDPTRGVDVAISLSAGVAADISFEGGSGLNGGSQKDEGTGVTVGLPVLVGINLGAFRLLLTPQLLYHHVSVLPHGILNMGGTVMFGSTSDRGFQLYPALAAWKALDPDRLIGSLSGPGPWMFQPALVFRWGN
jgi:hypothetical protein